MSGGEMPGRPASLVGNLGAKTHIQYVCIVRGNILTGPMVPLRTSGARSAEATGTASTCR